MATPVPYKLYKTSINGMPSVQALASPNTPYGYSEIDYAGLGQTAKELGDYYKNQLSSQAATNPFNYNNFLKDYNEKFGGDSVYNQISSGQYDPATLSKLFNLDANVISGFASGAPANSGYIIDDQGRFMQQSSLDQENYWKNELAAGRARNIGSAEAPMYVPIGSAADLNSQGKSFEQQLATPSVQQQIQQQNLQPVNPNTPQVTGATSGGVQGILPNGQTATFIDAATMAQYGAKPITPTVQVNASGADVQNSSTNLNSTPVTGLDVQSLLQKNQQIQQQILAQTQQTEREKYLQGQIQGVETTAQAGLNKIEDQTIPMGLVVGQQASLQRQANLKLQTLTNELSVLATNRENTLRALTLSQQFGTQNLQLAMQLEATKKAEAQAAQKLALEYRINKPFYNVAGTIYRTSDGKAYSSPEEFFKDAGIKDFGEAQAKGLVQENVTKPSDLQFGVVGETIDEFGNTIKQYGSFDKTTGQVTPVGGFNPSAEGMRTDRHNNPTAMTTDVAKTLGLVEGIDYEVGDKFPDSNLRTAKLLGNPIDITVKALDLAARDTNKQAFFTGSGAQRWTHTAMSDKEWLSKTPEQKAAVIAQMYKNEGGNGSLLQTPQVSGNNAADYMNAFKNAASLGNLSKFAQQQNQKTLQEALARGDFESARKVVSNTIFGQLGAAERTKETGRAEVLANLNAIQGYLSEYYAKGGTTNIFQGTLNDIANKIGTTLGYDAQFIQSSILNTLMNYRRSITGAAFSESESAEYAKLMPDIGKSGTFNAAAIEALRASVERGTGAVISNTIGNSLYDKLYGSGQVTPITATAYAKELTNPTPSNTTPVDNYLNTVLGAQTQTRPTNNSNAFNPRGWADVTKSVGNTFINTFKSAFGLGGR